MVSRRRFVVWLAALPLAGERAFAATSTNAQIRDQAVAELKLTTVGWLKSNGVERYPGGAPLTTHWGKAMNLLAQITDSTGGTGFGSGAWGG